MSTPQKAIWGGRHTFFVYHANLGEWNNVPGVYIFAGVDSMNTWQAKYIGTTVSFKSHMPDIRDLWDEARGLGATHIHAKTVQDHSARINLEQALIKAYSPPMNPF